MSFGGGFGGFGQQNNQQPAQTGFGGFGANANTNTTTGFGNTGFGAANNTQTGGLFGNNNATPAFGGSGGFGSTGGAFGGAKPSGFGQPAATTTGGSLFGNNNTATAGAFSGFGQPAATPASGGFGGGATNSLFGAKPATGFGTPAATTNPFGGSTGFGGNTAGAFGTPASTALSAGAGECQGTGSVPFQAFVEKEPGANSNQQNSFQNICFQGPYQKFSPEELRLADYNQGRRYGNASNQAGAFGQTNFGGGFGGGFGATPAAPAPSLFGGGAASTGFGASQPATTGFGSAGSGGLFGAPKPTTGLFGQPAAAPATGGGLFGGSTTGNTGFGGGGFGSTNTTTAAGGGLFGSTASKPAFSFGNQPAATTATGFGGSTTTAGGFGSGGGLFGNTQQNTNTGFGAQPAAPATTFGGFGNTQQAAPATSLFGAPKPATGLFGAAPATTGTSLFGNTAPAANASPFGNSTTTQNTGGLFGAKPATPSLFGGATNQTNTNTGSSLFGGGFGNSTQTQPQQQATTGGGLFGNLNNNNNQQKPSLFGGGTQQSGGGLFGSTNQQPQSSSLFGGMNNSQQGQQQQPQNSLFGGNNSMFGNSQQGQQSQGPITASISDPTAFGGSIFAQLGSNPIPNPGPLATPLLGGTKVKKNAALPMYKLNSASASRFSTPQKQRQYGFSYSQMSSPNSATSTLGQSGFGGSLLASGPGSSISRGLGLSKSTSTNSLRRSFSTEDSILAPGAFSASPGPRPYGSTGSVKRLTISRNIRQDLFSPPNPQLQQPSSSAANGILKKRVSFDAAATNNTNGASSTLKNSSTSGFEEPGSSRSRSGGNTTNGNSRNPEMEQVSTSNNQLAIVREEEPVVSEPTPSFHDNQVDLKGKDEGEYWMLPSKQEIEKMSRTQRQALKGLVVGRNNYGRVNFDREVDLTKINVDEIMGHIVVIEMRSITVYPVGQTTKPPMGQGLNQPSTIMLPHTMSRKQNGKSPASKDKEPMEGAALERHVKRLKSVPNTEFVNFDHATGVWIFRVQHFTTYGFTEDDEEDEDDFGQSTMSLPPNSPTPRMRNTPRSAEQSFVSTSQVTDSEAEDTFEFRKRKILPGAFDKQEAYVDDEPEEDYTEEQGSFLDERSVGSQSESGVDEPMDQDDIFEDNESVSVADQEMVGSYPDANNTAELEDDDSQDGDVDMDRLAETPGAVMRARMRAIKSGTPVKQSFAAEDDWANTLQATISPKKQNRALLKSLIDVHGNDSRTEPAYTPTAKRAASGNHGIATSIDLMNSLFGQSRIPTKAAKVPAKPKGFEWPYAKRPKTGDHDTSKMSQNDREFHDSMKPSWGSDGTLVYATTASNLNPFSRSSRSRAREKDGLLAIQKGAIISESRDVRFAKFSNEAAAESLKRHKELAVIEVSESAPFAYLPRGEFSFSDFATEINERNSAAAHEKLVWQLASVLFDPIDTPKELEQLPNITERLRRDKLSSFWQKLVEDSSNKHAAMARSDEERAIACLSGRKVADACSYLMNAGDYHLATLVALIGTKDSMRKDMRQQLDDWQKSRMLSEFSEPVRAIYELLAGNVCVCSGSKGPEDRIASFVMSKRFGLDWRQAFGLRLWYGILSNDSIVPAVEMFVESLDAQKETSRPQAWYVEQKVPSMWEDEDVAEREDLLWGLLKLYSFKDQDLEDVLRPENSQLSPLDTRLSWQLSQALSDSGCLDLATVDGDKTDRTTVAFASQLTNEGSWIDAIFVLLHLTQDGARTKAMQDHLAYHAGKIGAEDSQAFVTLTQSYKIPAAWIWEAKALYMRSVEKNPRAEVECLVKAGSYNEAHSTFSREVAPRAIIEMDYDTLRVLLAGFEDQEAKISEWHLGGEIYQDYLHILDYDKKGGLINHLVLQRLLAGLPAVVEEARHPAFMETVAVEIMGGVVAKTVIALAKNGERGNLSKVLSLPLTEDRYLKHTVELSLEYYKGVMNAAAK